MNAFLGREPCRIVGVVGIGHVAGIVEHWGKIGPQDIPPLLQYVYHILLPFLEVWSSIDQKDYYD